MILLYLGLGSILLGLVAIVRCYLMFKKPKLFYHRGYFDIGIYILGWIAILAGLIITVCSFSI